MEITVASPWFELIRDGKKIVEGRLNRSKFASFHTGTTLVINSSGSDEKVVAVVTRVCKYPTFKAYLSQEGLARTLPGVQSIKEGVAVYRQFYDKAKEKEHGVLAIHFVLV